MNQIKGALGELSCEYEKSLGFRRTEEEVIVLLSDMCETSNQELS